MPEHQQLSAHPVSFPPSTWQEHPQWADRAQKILELRGDGFGVGSGDGRADIEDRRALMIRSRDVPDWRCPPVQMSDPIDNPDEPLPLFDRDDLTIGIGQFRRYPNGLGFRLSATEPDRDAGGDIQSGPEAPNLGFRIRPDLPHRIRLLAYEEPGDTLATNTAHPGNFPDNDRDLWLIGGSGGRGRMFAHNTIGSWSNYFLSPYPRGRTLTVLIAYPELGVPPSGITLATDSVMVAPSAQS